MTTNSSNKLADPVFALIAAHSEAARAFGTALSIPESARLRAFRDSEETRTGDDLEAAERRLIRCAPQTLAGTVAALRHLVAPESGLLDGADQRHAVYLRAMVGRLTELIGPAH